MIQYQRLGDMLVQCGLISDKQLVSALKTQMETGQRLGQILLCKKMIAEEDLTRAIAEQYGYPVANMDELNLQPAALGVVDSGFAVMHLVLPYEITDQELRCVIADPLDLATTDILEQRLRRRVKVSLATESSLYQTICEAYGLPNFVSKPAAVKKTEPGEKRKRKVKVQEDRSALLASLVDLSDVQGRAA